MNGFLKFTALLILSHATTAASNAQALLPGEHDWLRNEVGLYPDDASTTLCVDAYGNLQHCASPLAHTGHADDDSLWGNSSLLDFDYPTYEPTQDGILFEISPLPEQAWLSETSSDICID